MGAFRLGRSGYSICWVMAQYSVRQQSLDRFIYYIFIKMKNNAALLFVRLLPSLKKHKPINLQLMHLRNQISKYCDHCSSVQRGVWVISAAYTQRILHLNKGVFAVNYAPITFAIAIAFNISALQPLLRPLTPLLLPVSTPASLSAQ